MFFIFQEVVKKYGKRAFPFIFILILIFYFLFSQEKSSKDDLQLISSVPETQNTEQHNEQQSKGELTEKVIVDIKGAVKYPGVYELTTEHRIIDAIKQAGGYTKEADSTVINHAQKLQDEMVIYIPKKGEDVSDQIASIQSQTTTTSNSTTSSFSNNGLVNINTANETELTTLSGIGPSKAQAIISYREENGPFKSIDEIKNVSGIGEKTYEKLKDSITVK